LSIFASPRASQAAGIFSIHATFVALNFSFLANDELGVPGAGSWIFFSEERVPE
jgi:hypothetical protein